MPLRARLTIRDEPFIIEDDEVDSLRAQGLLVGEPEPLEPPAPELPKPAQPAPPAAATTPKE